MLENRPSYTIKKSKKTSKFDNVVGEGVGVFYTKPRKFGADAKHGTIRKAKMVDKESTTPGVGQYNQNDAAIRASSISNPFTRTKKEGLYDDSDNMSQSGIIGPGHYNNLDTAVSSKSMKVKGGVIASAKKWKENNEIMPGPSSYAPNPFAI